MECLAALNPRGDVADNVTKVALALLVALLVKRGQCLDEGDARVDHGRKLARKKDEIGFFHCPNLFSTATGYRLSLQRQDHEPAAHETGYGVIFIQRVLGTGDDATGRVASLIGEGNHILVIMLRIADAVPASLLALASTRVAPEA